MATGNFTRTHFEKIYVVRDDGSEDWEWIGKEMVTEDLEANVKGFIPHEEWCSVGLRNDAMSVGFVEKRCNGYEIQYNILLIAGYYEHANIDLHVVVTNEDGDEWEREDLYELPQTVKDSLEAGARRIEKGVAKVTEAIRLVGTFSNGETVYEAIKK